MRSGTGCGERRERGRAGAVEIEDQTKLSVHEALQGILLPHRLIKNKIQFNYKQKMSPRNGHLITDDFYCGKRYMSSFAASEASHNSGLCNTCHCPVLENSLI